MPTCVRDSDGRGATKWGKVAERPGRQGPRSENVQKQNFCANQILNY